MLLVTEDKIIVQAFRALAGPSASAGELSCLVEKGGKTTMCRVHAR